MIHFINGKNLKDRFYKAENVREAFRKKEKIYHEPILGAAPIKITHSEKEKIKGMESTLLDSIGDCLSAVERLSAQIYGQLMRVHVCVGIC